MKKLAPFFVLFAGILWGLIGIFVRRLNVLGFTSMGIVALRAAMTTFLLFLILFCYNRSMLMIRPKDLWCFIGTGILSIVFFNYCYFKAITITSLSVAAVLLYTAPAIVMILSALLFRERITLIKMIALFSTFFGCILVTGIIGQEGNINARGVVFGLGAGLGYALYSVFSRYALDRGYHPLTISFYTFVCAMMGTLPLTDYRELGRICFESRETLLFCVAYGMISTVIPYIVYTLGLKEMENSQASIIASIEPVTATILGILVYHENLTLQEGLGMIFVIGAIVLCNCKNHKKETALSV